MPSLLPFSTNNNILISPKRSNFILAFFNAACHANSGAQRNFAGSSLHILRHIFFKFLNTSANNNLSL